MKHSQQQSRNHCCSVFSDPGYAASVKASRNEGGKGKSRGWDCEKHRVQMRHRGELLRAKIAVVRGTKNPQSKPKCGYGINGSIGAGNEKTVTACDGRYRGTAVKSRGPKAKQVSRWGTAARRKYNVTWGRRRSKSLQLLRCSLRQQGKCQIWCSGTTPELRGPIRAGWVEEQPQTQGPCSPFAPPSAGRATKMTKA